MNSLTADRVAYQPGLANSQLARGEPRKNIQLLVYFLRLDKSVELTSKCISDYVWRKKSRNGTQAIESANSTSTPPSALASHKTQCNRIPKLFQWLLPLSHRHLSALIHDKLSHLIHDKSSEGPIETRRWRGGKGGGRWGGETRGWRAGGEEARHGESAARHLNDQAVIAWFLERLLSLPRRACCVIESAITSCWWARYAHSFQSNYNPMWRYIIGFKLLCWQKAGFVDATLGKINVSTLVL